MKKKKKGKLGLLLQWAGEERRYIIYSVTLAFISGICSIGPYIGLYQILNAILQDNCTVTILKENVIFITFTTILRIVTLGISGVLSHKGAYRALFHVRCLITEHLAKVPLGELSDRSTGSIKTLLSEDIERLELFLAHNIPEMVSYMIGPVAIFAYLLTVNAPLALISLIPLPISFLILMFVYSSMFKVMGRMSESAKHFNSIMIEYISGMRVIKAFNMGTKSFRRFAGAIKEENDVWNEISSRTAPLYAIFNIILESGMLLIVPIGGHFFIHGSITASVFLLFIYIGSLYLTEVLALQQIANNFAQVAHSVDMVKEIIDLPVYEGGSGFPDKYDIELRNVDFSYNGNTNVLKNVSLCMKQGEKLALVGESGGGKSTIVQLISRFYDVNGGQILIGGKNIKEINYEEMLKHISIVFQKAFLTRESVLENITMGYDYSLRAVRGAAKKAQIDDFIMSLPDGYETKVGAFADRFSGGEKQRIALARAILKDAPILILDEATSAADPENEVVIDRAIGNLCENKTVIIIAHRLSAIKMCDRVAVVENHTIASCGTHKQMLEENAYYSKIWNDYNKARNITYSLEGDEAE